MKPKIKRLWKPSLRAYFTLGISLLLLWQRCADLLPHIQKLKTRDVIMPTLLAQLAVFAISTLRHPPAEAIAYIVIGNLVIVAFAMLPVTLKSKLS